MTPGGFLGASGRRYVNDRAVSRFTRCLSWCKDCLVPCRSARQPRVRIFPRVFTASLSSLNDLNPHRPHPSPSIASLLTTGARYLRMNHTPSRLHTSTPFLFPSFTYPFSFILWATTI